VALGVIGHHDIPGIITRRVTSMLDLKVEPAMDNTLRVTIHHDKPIKGSYSTYEELGRVRWFRITGNGELEYEPIAD